MRTTAKMKADIRQCLMSHPDVRLALMFGSYAKGTAHANSDLDLAVDGEGVDALALAAKLSEALSLDVDIVPLRGISIPLQQELIRTAVVVHEGEPGAGASWRTRTLLALEIDGPWYARMQDAWLARVAEQGL